jgi:Dolichyl-phosphate-mannose-protein mannosyltransferase
MIGDIRRAGSSKPPCSVDLYACVALVAHIALALSLRVSVWPEVTTPGYLWSRGLLLYRDIKFQHAPGTIGLLALAFHFFGEKGWVVRTFAMVWPLLAHVFVLKETRPFELPKRALTSAFLLASFYASDGSAVWPTVVIAALAIPIAAALSRGEMLLAGLAIGVAILFKQTAAYVLFLAVAALLADRRFRDAGKLVLAGSLPYLSTLLVFFALGAGADMVRWTVEVPFTVRPAIARFHADVFSFAMVVLAFLPLVIEAGLERPGEYATNGRWLVLVAAGLALICYPRFDLLQTVAAVPCLAVGAARLMSRQPMLLRRAAIAFVTTITLSRGIVLASGGQFDGKLTYWNDEVDLNKLVARLRQLPPETPLDACVFANVLPRTGLLPPGRLYVHPYFDWFFPVDRIGERIRKAAEAPGTVRVDFRNPKSKGEVIGPYQITRR